MKRGVKLTVYMLPTMALLNRNRAVRLRLSEGALCRASDMHYTHIRKHNYRETCGPYQQKYVPNKFSTALERETRLERWVKGPTHVLSGGYMEGERLTPTRRSRTCLPPKPQILAQRLAIRAALTTRWQYQHLLCSYVCMCTQYLLRRDEHQREVPRNGLVLRLSVRRAPDVARLDVVVAQRHDLRTTGARGFEAARAMPRPRSARDETLRRTRKHPYVQHLKTILGRRPLVGKYHQCRILYSILYLRYIYQRGVAVVTSTCANASCIGLLY